MNTLIRHFHTAITAPASLADSDRYTLPSAFLICLAGGLAFTASIFVTRLPYRMGFALFVFAGVALTLHWALSVVEKVALLNLAQIVGIPYREGKNVRSFLKSVLSLHVVYVYVLPVALIIFGVNNLLTTYDASGLLFVAYAVAFVAYLFLLFGAIKTNFAVKNDGDTLLLLLTPFFFEAVRVVVFLFYFSTFFVNYVSSIFGTASL